jgi:hypothetical protein
MMRSLLLSMLFATGLAHATELAPVEAQKIDYLIGSIEALQDAHFIRNGSTYDAKAAAHHLRLKFKYAGAHVHTADDFIRLCATASSITGKPYRIRFADGHEVPSATFLQDKLREYQAQHASGA